LLGFDRGKSTGRRPTGRPEIWMTYRTHPRKTRTTTLRHMWLAGLGLAAVLARRVRTRLRH